MRILVITHEYPPIGGGGGKAAQDLCRGFVKRGHQVRVLTTKFRGLPTKADDQGVYIQRLRSNRKKMYQASFLSMLLFVVQAGWQALWLIRRWQPSLLHIHFAVPAGPVGWLVNKFSGLPYVITVQLGDIPDGNPEKTKGWFRFVFPFTPPIWKDAAAIVAVSQFTRNLSLQSYDVPIKVIHNAIMQVDLQEDQIEVSHPLHFVFAGRLTVQKNPVFIIEMLNRVKDFKWQCTFIGDGELKSQILAAIQEYGLEERFHLPGWVSPEDVNNYFRKADVLLMPSLSEGMPIVGIQALANGLILLGSKIGGFNDLVEDGYNGFLLPVKDLDTWVAHIRDFLNDADYVLNLRINSLRKAEEFNLESIVQQYLDLFEQAVVKN